MVRLTTGVVDVPVTLNSTLVRVAEKCSAAGGGCPEVDVDVLFGM